jgi:hypothetical protein
VSSNFELIKFYLLFPISQSAGLLCITAIHGNKKRESCGIPLKEPGFL